MTEKTGYFTAVCGVKNSGKTTLIEGIVRTMTARGLRVAVVKHDGHDFECDLPGTDSFRFVKAGACGAAVFSGRQLFVRRIGSFPGTKDREAGRFPAVEDREGGRFPVTKDTASSCFPKGKDRNAGSLSGPGDAEDLREVLAFLQDLAAAFPEADVVLAEGLKGLPVPKIEVVRSTVSQAPVSDPRGRFLVVSDLPEKQVGERTLPFGDLEGIADAILARAKPGMVNMPSGCGTGENAKALSGSGTGQHAKALSGSGTGQHVNVFSGCGHNREGAFFIRDGALDMQVKNAEESCMRGKNMQGQDMREAVYEEQDGPGEDKQEQDFSHFDESGRARMVNVGEKDITRRTAVAQGRVLVNRQTFDLIRSGGMKKGDVLAVAQVAGIMGAKRTPELIPMCHLLILDGIRLALTLNEEACAVDIRAEVSCQGRTGVEMEALTAVSTAALTVYDMCKAVQKDMEITDIRLVKKTGGIHGDFARESTGT